MSISTPFFDPFDNPISLTTVNEARHAAKTLRQQFENGHGKSGYMLAILYDPGTVVTSAEVKQALGVSSEKAAEYYEKAFNVLHREADAGDAESMYLVALYFQSGIPPVSLDMDKYETWKNKAVKAGYRGVGQL